MTTSSFNLSNRSFWTMKANLVLLHVVITTISDMTETLVKAKGGGTSHGAICQSVYLPDNPRLCNRS